MTNRAVGPFWADVEGTEALEHYRRLVSTVSDGIYQLDPSGRFVAVNDIITEMTGYEREELLGQYVSIVIDEADVRRIERDMATRLLANEGVTGVYELTAHTSDGDMIPCVVRISVLTEDGQFDGTVGIVRDVSDRKENRRLRLYEQVLEQIQDGVYVLDERDRFVTVNDAFAEMLETTPDRLVDQPATAVLDDELLEEPTTGEVVEEIGSGMTARTVEHRFSSLPVHDDRSHRIGVARDVTDRTQRERAIKRYNEYIDAVLDAIDDIFYVVDEAGDLVRWNESLSAITGYGGDELGSLESIIREGDRDTCRRAIDEGFRHGSATVDVTIETRDGESIPYEFVVSTLEDPWLGTVLAGIGRDITERVEHRRALEASNERLESFAYAASHDLQEPLRMVTSYLQLVEDRYRESLGDDGREFVDFALDGAERMRAMIDGLLTYSRVETRGDPFEPVDLEAVLEDVVQDLSVAIEESGADITVEELPVVVADETQIRQVFQNLFENAIAYSGNGTPTVTVRAERSDSQWILAVEDDGIGIPPADQDRVFDVFQRLHTQAEQQGTGLGLALCRRIVERHGGRMWLESVQGEGTTVLFSLPTRLE